MLYKLEDEAGLDTGWSGIYDGGGEYFLSILCSLFERFFEGFSVKNVNLAATEFHETQ